MSDPKKILLLLLLVGRIAGQASPLVLSEIERFENARGRVDSQVGLSVAIDGDFAVVGTRGEVFVYQRVPVDGREDQWSRVATLDSDGLAGFFGTAVAISGDTIAVTATSGRGALFVFERSPGDESWSRKHVFQPGPEQSIGDSVSIDGDVMVVGIEPSSAWVYRRSPGGDWAREEILEPSLGHPPTDGFGHQVDVQGSTIAVGAPGLRRRTDQPQVGAVFVFEHSEGTWSESQRIFSSRPGPQKTGDSLVLDGDQLAICDPDDEDPIGRSRAGAILLYDRSPGQNPPFQQADVIKPTDLEGLWSIRKVRALDGDLMIVGGNAIGPGKADLAALRRQVSPDGQPSWSLGAPLSGDPPPDGLEIKGWAADYDQGVLLIGDHLWESQSSDRDVGAFYLARLLPHPEAPEFTSDPPAFSAINDGELFELPIATSDPTGQDVTLRGGDLPDWLTLTPTGDGEAILSGTPSADDAGTHEIRILAENTNGFEAAQCFHLTVVPVSAPPAILSFSASLQLLEPGRSTTLAWEVLGAEELTLQPGDISLSDDSGTIQQEVGATTTYLLVARNGSGASNAELTIHVAPDESAVFGSPRQLNTRETFWSDLTGFDYDGDGLADLLAVYGGRALGWGENTGDGFAEPILFEDQPVSINTTSLLTEDVDLDGDIDVLCATSGGFHFWRSRGFRQGYHPRVTTSTGFSQFSFPLLLFDVDGDDDLDAVLKDGDDIVWSRLANGTYSPPIDVRTRVEATLMAHGDFDKDGRDDIVYTVDDGPDGHISWMRNLARGNFSGPVFIANPVLRPFRIEVGDLDNDSWLDLVVSRVSDQILWFRNDQMGGWETAREVTNLSDSTRSLEIADLDNDGDLDVLAASEFDHKVSWYQNLGGGVFGPQQVIATSRLERPTWVEAVDMDGDGDLDFLFDATIPVTPVSQTGTFLVENLNGAPTATDPIIAGELVPGATLTAAFTYTDPDDDTAGQHLYQWFRADSAEGDGRIDISQANQPSYDLTPADVGKFIGFEVRPIAARGASPGEIATVLSSRAVFSQVDISVSDPSSTVEDSAAVVEVSLTRNGDLNVPLTINLTVGGTALRDDDYTASGMAAESATFPVGEERIIISLLPAVDNLEEPDETILVTLEPADHYVLLRPDEATIQATILNDDFAPVANPDPPQIVIEDGTLQVLLAEGLLANDTDRDDGDGPLNLTAQLVTDVLHGDLTLISTGGFIYTPNPDYFGPDEFTYRATDGTNFSNPVTVRIDVFEFVILQIDATTDRQVAGVPGRLTHTVKVRNQGPSIATNLVLETSLLLPAGVDLVAPVASTGAFSADTWTIPILDEDAEASLVFAFDLSPDARGAIDAIKTTTSFGRVDQGHLSPVAGASTSTSIISPSDVDLVEVDPSPLLNLQSGLLAHKVTLTNNNPLPLAGFRLLAANLPDDVQLYNRSGQDQNGQAFLLGNNELAHGASVTLTLEYFRPSLDPAFDPVYTLEAVFAEPPPALGVAEDGAEIDRLLTLENGDFLVEFTSTPGQRYAIEYTHDMLTWHRASPLLTATANRTQWIDAGPPKTSSHPSLHETRCYRIVTLPTLGRHQE